eukprot:TRINITY_DN258_c0_g1_i5.p1 TRINITY_DN258_c0_g1~~TRINITY_DN258_c0_g1_i5.p1  ORF type:complete len:620 (-),score=147.54 TRINITY_DN258_c0_g1_i5:316-2175(-)
MTYQIYRTWKTVDVTGLMDSYTQTVSIVDNEAPIFDNPPGHVSIECVQSPPQIPTVKAVDACVGTVDATLEQESVGVNYVQKYIRNWYATDPCGNKALHSQTITFTDETSPSFLDLTSNIFVECDNVPTTPNRGATDNCDPSPNIMTSSLRSDGNCPDTYAIVTTWFASDSSGNTANAFQTVNVVDSTPPVLSGIPSMLEITVSCIGVPTSSAGEATDNCDNAINVEFSQNKLPGTETDQYQLIRTWRAEDRCHNSVHSVQTIHVLKDTEAPIFTSVPQNKHTTCDEINPSPPSPSANDNCDESINVNSFSETRLEGSCSNEWTLIRTWIASDSFGNTATAEQTVWVVDNQFPTLAIPDNTVASCDDVPEPETPFATDSCGQTTTVEMVETREDSADSIDRYTLKRTWTVTDECGNDVSKTQEIKVDDTTKPTFVNIPTAVENSCENVDLSVPEVHAVDNCAGPVRITSTTFYSDYECIFTRHLIHTWIATDSSGNSRSASQTVSIYDTTAPVFDATELLGKLDITVGCLNIPPSESLSVTDNCPSDLGVTVTEENIFEYPYAKILRVWSSSDNCGNQVSHTQTITIEDTTPPTLTIPEDLTLECGSTIPFFCACQRYM